MPAIWLFSGFLNSYTKPVLDTRLKELEREAERMLATAPEEAPSEDMAIQALDLGAHCSFKVASWAANSTLLRSGQLKKRSGLSTPNGMGLKISCSRLRKAVELWAAGKGQHIERLRKALDLFVAWKKQYPKEAIGDDFQRTFRKVLDLWPPRFLDDFEDCRYIEEAGEAPKKPRDIGPPIPPKGGEIKNDLCP